MGADGSPPCRQARGPRRLAADNRLFREAVLRIARAGAPGAIFSTHSGLEFCLPAPPPLDFEGGVRESLRALSGDPDFEDTIIDGTIVRVHQRGAGAKGERYRHAEGCGPRRLGRLSRRGQGHSHAKDDGPAGSCRTDRLSWRQDRGAGQEPRRRRRFQDQPDAAIEALEMPFAFPMNAANPRLRHEEFDGKPRHFHAMPYGRGTFGA
jgi:hypothetical protein